MANLIPEVRVDKNGRKTTRWVKPEWARTETKKSIPPLGSGEAPAQAELVRALNSGQGMFRHGLGEAVAKTVNGKTAQRLVDFLDTPRDESQRRELQRAITVNIENPRIGKALNEMLVKHYDNAKAAGIMGVEDLLSGINEMNRHCTIEQEWALLKVTYAASHCDVVQRVNVPFPFDAYAITHEPLIDFILKNPDRADEIGSIIAERRTDDVTTIASLLNSDTHDALKHGTL